MDDEALLGMAATIYASLLAPTLSMAGEEAHGSAMRVACARALDLRAAMQAEGERRAADRRAEAAKAAEEEKKAAAEAKAAEAEERAAQQHNRGHR